MIQILLLSILLLTIGTSLNSELPEFTQDYLIPSNSSKGVNQGPALFINNRPLAKINGKVITLTDVIKQMDLFLFDYNPDLKLESGEKHQFYMSRWQNTLDELIGNELVLLDAEKKEIKVADGDVREELGARFGPNVMSSLDKVNLSYEEARTMIRSELTVQQLIGMKVHAKAFQMVTPKVIKSAYKDYVEKNPPEETLSYQILSIRGKDQKTCEELGQTVYNLLYAEKLSLDEAMSTVSSKEQDCTITVSEEFKGDSSKLSTRYYDILKPLMPNGFSEPVSQISRVNNEIVVRLFYLKDKDIALPSNFQDMHDPIKNELLYKTSAEEKDVYINLLKKQFGYDYFDPKFDLPKDYHPFLLL